jgi:hypothetical protein
VGERQIQEEWMKRTIFPGGVAALVGALSLAVGSATTQQSVEVTMMPQNGSGHSGMATLYAEGDKTRVVLELDNPVPGPEPAHVHLGSCPVPNAAPLYPLTPVVNGTSETLLDLNLGALVAEPMAINVHKSPQEASVYVSCGDIALEDDFTEETTVDSVRENAREGTSDELLEKRQKDRFKE